MRTHPGYLFLSFWPDLLDRRRENEYFFYQVTSSLVEEIQS